MAWLKGLSLAWKAVLAAAVLALIGFAGWWLFVRPAELKQQATQSNAGRVVAETQTQAARETVDIIVRTQETLRTIDVRTAEQTRAILNAPGAEATLSPELVARGRIALCLQHNRTDDPVCAALFHGDGDGERDGSADTPRLSPSGFDGGGVGRLR
jgi:hypothetical protein